VDEYHLIGEYHLTGEGFSPKQQNKDGLDFYLDGANGIIMDESQQLSSHRMNIIQ
jgi:hypothetical protein